MKKRHLFWIIPLGAIVTIAVCWLISFYTSPVKFKKIYTDSNKCKALVTEKEIKSDLEMMKYYFQYAYSGYEEAVAQGFNIDEAVSDILEACKKELETNKKINSRIVTQKIYEVLNKKLTLDDGHIHIYGQNYSAPYFEYRAYYSDIYLVKKSDGIYVYKSNVENVKPGTKFEGSQANLIDWFDGSKKVWRFGVVSKKKISSLMFMGSKESVSVPVAKDEDLKFKQNWANVRSTNDTVYISVSDFNLLSYSTFTKGFSDTFLKEFYTKIKTAMPDKKNVILDLRNNGGGNGTIPADLLSAILYYNTEDTASVINSINYEIWRDEFRIESPVLAQIYSGNFKYEKKEKAKLKKLRKENPDVEYYDIPETDHEKRFRKSGKKLILHTFIRPYYNKMYDDLGVYDKSKVEPLQAAQFDGDFYILLNHNSGSASEYTVAEASMIEKASSSYKLHIVGENSAGAVSYFNPMNLVLPNTGTIFYMPTAYGYADAFKNDERYYGEAKGWYPETWSDNKNLLNTLVNITGDKELETELAGLQNNLL